MAACAKKMSTTFGAKNNCGNGGQGWAFAVIWIPKSIGAKNPRTAGRLREFWPNIPIEWLATAGYFLPFES